MDFRRALLSISLGLVILLIWQAWLEYEDQKNFGTRNTTGVEQAQQPEVPSVVQNGQGSTTGVASTAEELPQAPSASASGQLQSGVVPAAVSALESAGRISVQTDLIQAEIDEFGGELRAVELTRYPVEVDTPEIPFSLLSDSGAAILVAQSGLVGNGDEFPNHQTQFKAESSSYTLAEGQDSISVPLHWTSPAGVRYIKTYTFYRDQYLVDVDFTIYNDSQSHWQGYQYGQFLSTEFIEQSEGFWFFRALPSYRGAAVYTPQDKYDKIDYDEIRSESPSIENTPSGWVAMLQHYFVTAWLPQENSPYRFYTRTLGGSGSDTRYQVGYISLTSTQVSAGSQGKIHSQLYVGPKEQDRIDSPAEGLILTVDYGWLTPVSSPLFWFLEKIYGVVKNWGWSIILLTLLVKIVFYPLSAASYKSMAKMKKLQPRLKTLKERYGDDKQKMNQEMMQIYKKEKINPLGGCLPILIQIPVFIALYWVLLESVELRQAPFIFWLNDLSRSDPFYVLPVLMGISMFAQQLLNPTPLDSMQKNIMMSLPIVFTFFFLWFPSGLVLYWLVNNVLSIAQQWYITRKLIAT